jgi:hypothetical protein
MGDRSVSEIADFIKARLDEDEADARSAGAVTRIADEGYPWLLDDDGNVQTPAGPLAFGDWKAEAWVIFGAEAHVARHDPARVLREIAAKRGVIREMEAARADLESRLIHVPFFITWTLMHLAKPYADHPDYKRDWHID